uniref:Antitermination protein Q n=1 Tax=Salmonella phage vB_SEnST11_KE23 TaxID=3161174 RepID=A0AAU8GI65_9CAUD
MSYGLLTPEQAEILKKRFSIPTAVGDDLKKIGDLVGAGSKCLHDACPQCGGTGVRKDGSLCFHGISCPCDKCSVKC